jgi:hypothetical protein
MKYAAQTRSDRIQGKAHRIARPQGDDLLKYPIAAIALTVLLAATVPAFAQNGTCAGMTPGQLTSLNGFVPFTASSLWNTDISSAPVDPNSANIINYIGSTITLHPDFGSGTYQGQSIGIPYQVVAGSQAKITVNLGDYGDESDPGPMPIPSNALIEGYPAPGDGDRHVLLLDKDNCWLYELYNAVELSATSWSANSTAIWDMTIDPQRPYTWTSADAAGLPIFPGLVRYDEVAAGAINHAVRFTVPVTQQAFTPPASHWASSVTDSDAPPMGTRLRLQASFDISSYSAQNQVILTALKKYGMILADNGSAIYISGAPDPRWNNSDLHLLSNLTGADFDVVTTGPIYTSANVPTGANPTIGSFTTSAAYLEKGRSATLTWSTSNSIYNIISPGVGPVRGNSITVTPTSTTTYTLYSTNQYGRTTATATVAVQRITVRR